MVLFYEKSFVINVWNFVFDKQILSLICFVLLLLDADDYYYTRVYHYTGYHYWAPEQYLILVCFANWYTVTLMLIAALLSLGTASILPKTSFVRIPINFY